MVYVVNHICLLFLLGERNNMFCSTDENNIFHLLLGYELYAYEPFWKFSELLPDYESVPDLNKSSCDFNLQVRIACKRVSFLVLFIIEVILIAIAKNSRQN